MRYKFIDDEKTKPDQIDQIFGYFLQNVAID